jgi:AcrR family transcriptional regulator
VARRRSAEDLREAILDACERCLEKGAAEITTRAVMAEAGVSTGTLYHYFGTLDELLLAVAMRAAARQGDEFGDPSTQGVATVIARLFDPERRDTVLPWLRQRAIASAGLRDALRQYDDVVRATFASAVAESAAATALPEGLDLEAAVEVVRALAEGYQLRLSSGTLGVSPERFVATFVGLIDAGWLSPPGRASR